MCDVCLNTPSKVRFHLNFHPKTPAPKPSEINFPVPRHNSSTQLSWSNFSTFLLFCRIFTNPTTKGFPYGIPNLVTSSSHITSTCAFQCLGSFTKTFLKLQSSHPPPPADQFRCSEFTDITRSQAKLLPVHQQLAKSFKFNFH